MIEWKHTHLLRLFYQDFIDSFNSSILLAALKASLSAASVSTLEIVRFCKNSTETLKRQY